MSCCNYQPLPLFRQDPAFIDTIVSRDPELILAIQALSLRFNPADGFGGSDVKIHIDRCAQQSRDLVMERISHGTVELSTLQSLCLLTMFDFTGNRLR